MVFSANKKTIPLFKNTPALTILKGMGSLEVPIEVFMRKVIIVLAAIALVIVAGCTGLTIAYTNSADYESETVPDNITINGVDCSGLSYEDTEKKLTEKWNSKTFTINGMLDENLGTYTDLGCTYDIKDQIRILFRITWI